jgi:hypothetical protein
MTHRSCIGNADGLQSNFSWRQDAAKLTLPGCALYPESCIYYLPALPEISMIPSMELAA